MDAFSITIDFSKIFWSALGGLSAMVAVLISVLWRNVKEQLGALKSMSQMVATKLDTSHQDMMKTIETIKLRQTEHDLLIATIREHNSSIENQLRNLYAEVSKLPQKIINSSKQQQSD